MRGVERGLLRARGGFTLLELLIVVAIIGIIAALLIPNLLEALNKSKQKRTMTDIRLTGTAWFSWVTDQVAAGAAGASANLLDWSDLFTVQGYGQLEEILVPDYAAFIPQKDAWGNNYEYGATADPNDTVPIGVRSTGADGEFQVSDEYTPGAFLATDFIQDIVWAGGYFVRWPAGHLVE
ncbi:MAG TPA: prepilin-type N-terminal cleavage/methylation domain-containing protein [Thermoanaerobaculia bacterium]|nr:prepilin-type N-terminal cleavage/methylation domain-containing protein [Thermoanaerobaculia bacterium]